MAAGVVFYGLLAIFPAVTAFVSLYGLFAKASTVSDHLALASGFIPSGGVEIIQEQINRITAKGDARLSLAFAFSLGLALWSANAGMKAVIDALNVTYNEKEKRGFIKLNLISLALTIGAILSLLVALGSIVVLPLVLSSFGLEDGRKRFCALYAGRYSSASSSLVWPFCTDLAPVGSRPDGSGCQ